MKKPELISPAGSLKKLKYGITYGADAIYCGVPDFSLRTRINSFNLETIKEGIEYAHSKKKKAYVTFNIYGHNDHIKKLPNYIKKIKEYGADALIISDPGIMAVARKNWPKVRIHLSTQANVTNWQAAKFWYQQGVKRIVLARECTLDEIREIHYKVPKLEIECFVHGAMCMSYSGRCILSKYFTNKSANLGDCTQPCRWQYNHYLEEVKRPGDLLPIEEDEHGTYILNSKDLCLIKYLDELQKAGVSSFKIEGRAKSIYYLSVVIKAYRMAIDDLNINNTKLREKRLNILFKDIQKTANRGFTTGFLFGKDKFENEIKDSHSKSDWVFVGEVIGNKKVDKKKGYDTYIQVHNQLEIGDIVEVIQPEGDNIKLVIKKMLNKETDAKLEQAHGGIGVVVVVEANKNIKTGSLLIKRKINLTV